MAENHTSQRQLAYSPREVGWLISVSKSTVYRLIGEGRLYCVRAGERYIIPHEAVESFLRGQPYEPAGTAAHDKRNGR